MSSLIYTADSLTATPTVGATEFDGKALYATPQGTQRGIIPVAQFFRLNADLVGTNVATAQSTFGVGVTLSSSTVYVFEGVYLLSKTAGATAHTLGTGFGGAATITQIAYTALGYIAAANPLASTLAQSLIATSATATAVTGSVASATSYATVIVKGTVSINAGGTFTPQYILSAAPGGAYSTLAGSYFSIHPVGTSGANTSVGAWA